LGFTEKCEDLTEKMKNKVRVSRIKYINSIIMKSLKTNIEESVVSVKKGCVFLVDDNPVFLTVLENEIKEIFPFAKVKCFTTGEEALLDVASAHPFLVFLDYDLAGGSTTVMNGISVLKKIKHEVPDAEVVMLSGIDTLKIVTTSMKNGAFDYIIKGEKAFYHIRQDVTNIMRRLRSKEESKEYRNVMRLLKWIAILISFIFMFVLYHYYYPSTN
jgi:two-component system OmpR family response regulator